MFRMHTTFFAIHNASQHLRSPAGAPASFCSVSTNCSNTYWTWTFPAKGRNRGQHSAVFLETKDSKEQSVLNTCNQLLKIVLHDYGMKGLDENALSTRAISNHLAVRRKSIAKHRSNKIPFKKMQASRKKQGLSKKSFIFQHNPLCQLMVQFWNEHSTPSPNKKDVKWIHSKQPGDHVRVHNEDNTTFTVQCMRTTSKCRKDQRRWCTSLLCWMHCLLTKPLWEYVWLARLWIIYMFCRYALGTDYKIYQKFLETHTAAYPDLPQLVKQWRFRLFKPFNISKPEQQYKDACCFQSFGPKTVILK